MRLRIFRSPRDGLVGGQLVGRFLDLVDQVDDARAIELGQLAVGASIKAAFEVLHSVFRRPVAAWAALRPVGASVTAMFSLIESPDRVRRCRCAVSACLSRADYTRASRVLATAQIMRRQLQPAASGG